MEDKKQKMIANRQAQTWVIEEIKELKDKLYDAQNKLSKLREEYMKLNIKEE